MKKIERVDEYCVLTDRKFPLVRCKSRGRFKRTSQRFFSIKEVK